MIRTPIGALLGIAAWAFLAAAPARAVPITIGTNTTDWQKSTQVAAGGPGGVWTTTVSAGDLPDLATYTLAPQASGLSWIAGPAASLGVQDFRLDGGNNSPAGVQFFRTTFAAYDVAAAEITLAVDNDAQVFINGQEVAREISWTGANWTAPLPSLTVGADGSISNVVEFDQVFSFTNWNDGENEVVLVGRNPDNEGPLAGGIAFRMVLDAETAAVAEPSSIALFGLAAGLLIAGRRRHRRHR
jgi:hypothetical protein